MGRTLAIIFSCVFVYSIVLFAWSVFPIADRDGNEVVTHPYDFLQQLFLTTISNNNVQSLIWVKR